MTYDERESSRNAGAPIECYRFVVGDTVYLWTSSDAPANLGGETYALEPIRCSGADFSNEDHAGTITVYVNRFNPVAQMYIAFTPPTPVKLTLYRFHDGDPDFITAFAGTVVSASFEGSEVALTCARRNLAFKRKIPRVGVQKRCPLVTYELDCGLDRELFKDTGSVVSVSGYQLQVVMDVVRADGWYALGCVQLADGTRRFVTEQAADILTLEAPFFTIAPGDPISIFWGDDHLEETCRSKFSNMAHFKGEPRVPEKDVTRQGLNP